MSRVEPLVLRGGDELRLREWLRSSTIPAGLAQRARIVLLAAEGASSAEVGRLVGVSLPTMHSWRVRYTTGGLAALDDRPRSGRPPMQTSGRSSLRRWSRRRPLWASRTGRRGCWPTSSGLASPPWRGAGVAGASSRGRPRRSSSPPTPSSRPRSGTSSRSTWTRRPGRSWCASNENTQIQALDRTAPILPI